MKVEIINLKTIKLIAENNAEKHIISEWIDGVFEYKEGSYSSDCVENTYKFKRFSR